MMLSEKKGKKMERKEKEKKPEMYMKVLLLSFRVF